MSNNKPLCCVLIADDEVLIADTLTMILNMNGFNAQAVYSGEQAVAVALSFRPDILISDFMMGGMNGVDAAIKIRESLPNCRVILSSGYVVSGHILERAESVGNNFKLLPKPVHPTQLLSVLAQ